MNETRELRRHFAMTRTNDALWLARTGKFESAMLAAQEAIALNDVLPHSHVIISKISFWNGDLDAAERSLKQAAANGLALERLQVMQLCIDEFRNRCLRADKERKRAVDARQAFRDSIIRSWWQVVIWFTIHRLSSILFFIMIFVLLTIGRPH